MANSIKTTGQLREFLVNMLIGVKDGLVENDKARNLTKMAAQINESFYSEIKIAKIQQEAGKVSAELGLLPINR
jgi:hypothetical protein